jgi:hypothetical protein
VIFGRIKYNLHGGQQKKRLYANQVWQTKECTRQKMPSEEAAEIVCAGFEVIENGAYCKLHTDKS